MIGMTASPGTDQESVDEVCMNLGLNQRLVRTKDDPDVVEYVQPTPEEVVRVPLDPLVEEPVKRFRRLAQKTYDRLNETGRPEVFRESLGDTTSKSRVLKLIESGGRIAQSQPQPSDGRSGDGES
jgi:Fanconi anemia group M protein